MTSPSIHRTARDIARDEISRAIVASGRQQLGEVGPSELSLRAVARDLGMASSAVYRYFPSRDDLLTALVVQIYTELADALEGVDLEVTRRGDFAGRWLRLATGLHDWARTHRHDYALVYGSPVPGYAAPQSTVDPSARVTGVLITMLADVQAAGQAPDPDPVPRPVRRAIAGLREGTGAQISDDLLLRGVRAWGALLGAISLELFGHLYRAVDDHDAYFPELARRICPF